MKNKKNIIEKIKATAIWKEQTRIEKAMGDWFGSQFFFLTDTKNIC